MNTTMVETENDATVEDDPKTVGDGTAHMTHAPLAANGATVVKDGKDATPYHVVAVVLGEIPEPEGDGPRSAEEEDFRRSHVPGVPFIIGGHDTPELFESTSGPEGAKRAALDRHPELKECVREPGISLATWPARSYNLKRVEAQPQPDKLVV